MQTADSFNTASAQAAALPDTQRVELSSGGHALVCRLSWLQFEALWSELAQLFAVLVQAEDQAQRHRDAEKQESPPACSVPLCLCGENSSVINALIGAPQFVLKLASLGVRLPETELAQWPPCDVLAIAASSLELNFIRPAGVRDFFASVARLGG